MTPSRVLIAGVGNIFLGDDAFGVEVAQRLARRLLPEGVRVVDFGIRGLDLAYALADGYELVILVDAVPRGEAPGTLYLIEPDPGDAPAVADLPVETHALDPGKVLRLASASGNQVGRVLLVGCEPVNSLDPDQDMHMGLSAPVEAAVDRAIELIESTIADFFLRDRSRLTNALTS